MNLDQNEKDAVQTLSDAINSAVERSYAVRSAIEDLRELGFEPNLAIKLEIGLREIIGSFDEFSEDAELDLTDEDVKALRRMKIII